MKEVLKALRPVKRRLRRNRFLKGAAAGLAAGLGAAAATQAAAFFIPVQDRGLWAAAAAAAVTVLTALGNALRPVRNEEAAKAADACGLKERAITALEGGDEPIRRLQRKDACGALEKLDVKKIRPGNVRKALTAALCCAAALACLILIPSPKDSDAEARKVLTRTLREGRETIERAAEEDEKTLTEEKKSELRKITGDLSRELDGSRDAADALVALDRAEKRLEEFRQKTAGDAAEGSETGNGENSDRGSGAGENGETGDPGQAAPGQQQAAAGTVPTAAQMKTLQAMAALKGAVSPAGAGSMYAQAALGSQGGQSGSGASGTGNGNKAGNGAGEGSTNEEQTGGGKSGSSGHAEGTRPARYKEEQYETIYDPEHIDKAKQDAATDQNRLSDEDSLQLETGPGRGSLSGDVPWGEALQDYADTEARAADRENLTIQERQWVDEYYRLLTEQK